jgi:hypothetical protein
MKVLLSGKEYVCNLVGLGFQHMLPHFFLINYLRPMGVEVAGLCDRGAGVVGLRGRGTGVAGPCGGGLWVVSPCGRGRPTGVGPTTMLIRPGRWV